MTEPRLTKAQRRVLAKADVIGPGGGVRIAGGFGGKPEPGQWKLPGFDRRSIVERLVARRLLRPTDAFNTYATTDAGAALLRSRRPQQESRA